MKNLDLDVENKFLFVKDKSKVASLSGIKVYDKVDLISFCK